MSLTHLVKLYAAGIELTLACPCRCSTCGSYAGLPRSRELDVPEWLAVVSDLAGQGCTRLTLLGGEPLVFREWPRIARAATDAGMTVDMVTSGIGLDDDTASLARASGLVSVTVSVDGTRDVHDSQRRLPGSWDAAMDAVRALDAAGLRVGVTSQVNRATLPTLAPLAPLLEEAGAVGWQLQLTIPSGRAMERSDLVVDAGIMPEVAATVRRLVGRRGLRPFVTDNIGWMTRDDPLLRTPPRSPERCWMGCFAGLRVVGLTSDGGVKGCLSLPDSLVEGNVRDEPFPSIWKDMSRFGYNRGFDPSSLSGPCATCPYGRICRGGCTATAIAMHGRPGTTSICLGR